MFVSLYITLLWLHTVILASLPILVQRSSGFLLMIELCAPDI